MGPITFVLNNLSSIAQRDMILKKNFELISVLILLCQWT